MCVDIKWQQRARKLKCSASKRGKSTAVRVAKSNKGLTHGSCGIRKLLDAFYFIIFVQRSLTLSMIESVYMKCFISLIFMFQKKISSLKVSATIVRALVQRKLSNSATLRFKGKSMRFLFVSSINEVKSAFCCRFLARTNEAAEHN